MTLQEAVKQCDCTYVHVLSYGYMSSGIFSHYEPFGNSAREILFDIAIWDDGDIDLVHKRFFFLNEKDEDFYIKDNVIYCNDPELKEVPDNDF